MFGQVSYDVEVDVSASNAWKLYGTLQLAVVMEEGPSPLLENFELIEGDGGVGTVIKLIFAPGKGITLTSSLSWISFSSFITLNDRFLVEFELRPKLTFFKSIQLDFGKHYLGCLFFLFFTESNLFLEFRLFVFLFFNDLL